MLQMLEIIALVELNYPDRLEQFFQGFSFALLIAPPELDYTSSQLVNADRD